MSESSETWLETDYETEGTLALEMTVEQLRKVHQERYRWKWVVTSLHNSVQGFLVKACSGSDLLGAMTEKYQKHWYECYRKGKEPNQRERLATVPELLKRAGRLKGDVNSQPLKATAEQKRAITALSNWRDTFIHYKPGSLSIEVSGFPLLVARCLDVVDFLAFESGHVFNADSEMAQRARKALKESRLLLTRLEKANEADANEL